MKKEKAKKAVQVISSFFLSFVIFYLVYRDQDPNIILYELGKSEVPWLVFPVFLGAFSHFVRALRWKQLIEPLGKTPKTSSSYIAVMIGYFSNYLIPRAGEMARCAVIKKTDGASFSELLGTVIAERIFDLAILILFIGAAILSQWDLFTQVFASSSFVGDGAAKILCNPFVWLVVGGLMTLLLLLRKQIRQSSLCGKTSKFLKNIFNGLKTFLKVENKPLFVFYTIIIWICYFNMTYLCFMAFDFTEHLDLSVGLSTFAIGSMGIVAPVQGGIGAWHFLTSECLKFYGVEAQQALTFAFVVHLAQTMMILVIGFACFIAFSFIKKAKA